MIEARSVRKGQVLAATHEDMCYLKLSGDIRLTLCKSMDEYIAQVFSQHVMYKRVYIDVREADAIDSTSLGLLAKIAIYAKSKYGLKPIILSTNPSITKLLKSVGFEQIFFITSDIDEAIPASALASLPVIEGCCEKEERKRVIDAHKTLMSLNDANRLAFTDLVSSLEKED